MHDALLLLLLRMALHLLRKSTALLRMPSASLPNLSAQMCTLPEGLCTLSSVLRMSSSLSHYHYGLVVRITVSTLSAKAQSVPFYYNQPDQHAW